MSHPVEFDRRPYDQLRRAASARHAALTRHGHSPDSPDRIRARQDLVEGKVGDYIERQLAAAPPLRPEQRERLARLLAVSAQAGGDGV